MSCFVMVNPAASPVDHDLFNCYPFNDIETDIPRLMLLITDEQAISKEFSEDAYRRAAEPKVFRTPATQISNLYGRVI